MPLVNNIRKIVIISYRNQDRKISLIYESSNNLLYAKKKPELHSTASNEARYLIIYATLPGAIVNPPGPPGPPYMD